LQVTWDESGAEKRSTQAIMAEYKQLSQGADAVDAVKKGDVEAGLKGAVHTIDAEFEFSYLAHAPMEPLTAVARLSPDKCAIWAGCQFQTVDHVNAAQATGLNPDPLFISTPAARCP